MMTSRYRSPGDARSHPDGHDALPEVPQTGAARVPVSIDERHAILRATAAATALRPAVVLSLQRSTGNVAVTRLLDNRSPRSVAQRCQAARHSPAPEDLELQRAIARQSQVVDAATRDAAVARSLAQRSASGRLLARSIGDEFSVTEMPAAPQEWAGSTVEAASEGADWTANASPNGAGDEWAAWTWPWEPETPLRAEGGAIQAVADLVDDVWQSLQQEREAPLFPTSGQVFGNPVVAGAMNIDFEAGKQDFLEHGAWVFWDRRTDAFSVRRLPPGDEKSLDSRERPADEPPRFVVGFYHTHPPLRPGTDPAGFQVGASPQDKFKAAESKMPSAVVDFADEGRTAETIFFIGPVRRGENTLDPTAQETAPPAP